MKERFQGPKQKLSKFSGAKKRNFRKAGGKAKKQQTCSWESLFLCGSPSVGLLLLAQVDSHTVWEGKWLESERSENRVGRWKVIYVGSSVRKWGLEQRSREINLSRSSSPRLHERWEYRKTAGRRQGPLTPNWQPCQEHSPCGSGWEKYTVRRQKRPSA